LNTRQLFDTGIYTLLRASVKTLSLRLGITEHENQKICFPLLWLLNKLLNFDKIFGFT